MRISGSFRLLGTGRQGVERKEVVEIRCDMLNLRRISEGEDFKSK